MSRDIAADLGPQSVIDLPWTQQTADLARSSEATPHRRTTEKLTFTLTDGLVLRDRKFSREIPM